MTTTALAQWFGTNRTCAYAVGEELAGCNWVGIVFAGGMTEVPYITARTIALNDRHRHVMNLSAVVADPARRVALYRAMKHLPFHPDVLAMAQERCRQRERLADDPDSLFATGSPDPRFEQGPDVDWAADYFVCAWMTRAGSAGTPAEFKAGLSQRWDAGGGGSVVRFHSAARGLVAWSRAMRRCECSTLDFRDFLAKCKDAKGHGVYSDSPFPDAGDAYTHNFTDADHRDLCRLLTAYRNARVVVRFYDHPLIRELYPEGKWTWRRLVGRKQTNESADELLILNGPSLAR